MSTMHVSESIPAYALSILEDAEQAVVQRHLSHCAACREELSAYQEVVAQLPEAIRVREELRLPGQDGWDGFYAVLFRKS